MIFGVGRGQNIESYVRCGWVVGLDIGCGER